jgi:hypothetical protein
MPTRERQRVVNAQIGWMLGAILFLTVLDLFSLQFFFMLSLIGFLVIVELTDPITLTPRWRRRLRILAILLILAFFGIAVRRILSSLPEGLL